MFEMSTERPRKIDCSLVKYLILSLLMKRDVSLDERFMQGEQGTRGEEGEGEEARGEREGSGSLPLPLTGLLFDLPAYYSLLETLAAASLSRPRLFLSASFPLVLPLSSPRRLSRCPGVVLWVFGDTAVSEEGGESTPALLSISPAVWGL